MGPARRGQRGCLSTWAEGSRDVVLRRDGGQGIGSRLLEIAGERMRAEQRMLLADDLYYDQLADKKRKSSEEWTIYYSGSGPPPDTRRLP